METIAGALSIRAHAKLNLRLEVGPKAQALHSVASVMADLELADELLFSPSAGGFSFSCAGTDIPKEENLVWRAAHALSLPLPDVNITLHKHIPQQAGLGGGSADAAATLAGLSLLYTERGVSISATQLSDAALRCGSDVPSCLVAGLKTVAGVGDVVLSRACAPPPWGVVLLRPSVRSSTALAYQLLDEQRPDRQFLPNVAAQSEAMCAAFAAFDLDAFCSLLHNDFGEVIERALPAVAQARRRLDQAGARATILCGSGSCVAGFFERCDMADEARERLELGRDEWSATTGFLDGR